MNFNTSWREFINYSKRINSNDSTCCKQGKFLITEHASVRMWERNVSRIMIDKCLLTGHIQPSNPIKFNDEMQTCECRMSNYYAGVDYDVVTAINPNDPTAIIVTVIDTKDLIMYQYKQSGLDNVWLVNGFEVISTPYGNAVKFENANELDGAIAKALLHKNEVMNGKEFRFLRQQIGMSQNDVARFMQLDVQTIARWEKEQIALPFANDAILRFLYSSYTEKEAQILPMIETMKIIDKCANSKLFLSFDTKKTHWGTTENCSA